MTETETTNAFTISAQGNTSMLIGYVSDENFVALADVFIEFQTEPDLQTPAVLDHSENFFSGPGIRVSSLSAARDFKAIST